MTRNQLLLLLGGLAAALWLGPTLSADLNLLRMQEPLGSETIVSEGETRVIVMPPRREPYWGMVDCEDGRPYELLTVPEGRRFVLTDLWTMRHHEFPSHFPGPNDRIWLEDEFNSRRRVVFDTFMTEWPHVEVDDGLESTPDFRPRPMHWESGMNFGPGHQLWFNYDFAGSDTRNFIRRIQFTGYFEDAAPAQ